MAWGYLKKFIENVINDKDSCQDGGSGYGRYRNRDKFYRSFFAPEALSEMQEIAELDNLPVRATDHAIQFWTCSFGDTMRSVMKKMRNPRYQIEKHMRGMTYSVLFYKVQDGMDTLSQFHFINNHFFFASITFFEQRKKNVNKILEIFLSKYLEDKSAGIHLSAPFSLSDKDLNKAVYIPDKFPAIFFFSGRIFKDSSLKTAFKYFQTHENNGSEIASEIVLTDFI